MCGIAGIYDVLSTKEGREACIDRMIAVLRHRGPDGDGRYSGEGVTLAHARLSIIDLVGGKQPIGNEDGSIWIILNGEIFNYIELRQDLEHRGHVFTTKSDTEVILHLYEDMGSKCLALLNGQFAIAIWDTKRRELFLARDRSGICPLYYYHRGSEWIFASEIKALLSIPSIPRSIDPVAIDDVFTFWFPLSPRTAFQGIFEVPPAHWIIVGEGGARMERYWDLPVTCDAPGVRSEEDYAEELLSLLIDATRLRLRSDVPVGAYLSGGLDSSITSGIIRKYTGSPLTTFSISFEDPEFDESSKQAIMSSFLGTDHRDIRCHRSDIASLLPLVMWHAESPLIRTAPVPLFSLSRGVRKSGYKVVITGEGADEVLAGYDIFKEDKVRRFMEAFPESRIRPLLLKKLYPYLRHSPTQFQEFAKLFFAADGSPFLPIFHSHAPRWNMTSMTKMFFSEDLRRKVEADWAEDRIYRLMSGGEWPAGLDPLSIAQAIEIKTLLAGYLLSSQGDRMLMGNSVEGRFPYLDHRVIEFCMRLPPGLRMHGLQEKYLLRKCASGIIPNETLKSTKQPYRAPDASSFFQGSMPEYAEELLSNKSIREKGYFNPEKVDRIVAKCRSGKVLGFKDNIAFVGILSTQLLDEIYIRQRMVPTTERGITTAASF